MSKKLGTQLLFVIDELTQFIETHDAGPRLAELREVASSDPDGFMVAQTRWPYDDLMLTQDQYTQAIVLHGRLKTLCHRVGIPGESVPALPISHFGQFQVVEGDEVIDVSREVVIPRRVIAEQKANGPCIDASVVIAPNGVTWKMKMASLRAAASDYFATQEGGTGISSDTHHSPDGSREPIPANYGARHHSKTVDAAVQFCNLANEIIARLEESKNQNCFNSDVANLSFRLEMIRRELTGDLGGKDRWAFLVVEKLAGIDPSLLPELIRTRVEHDMHLVAEGAVWYTSDPITGSGSSRVLWGGGLRCDFARERDHAVNRLRQWIRAVQQKVTRTEYLHGGADTASDTVRDRAHKPSTQKGEATRKIIAALAAHHQYENDSCLNLDPIGVTELARLAKVGKGTASDFFKTKFNGGKSGGYARYRMACRDVGTILHSLQLLLGDVTPSVLFKRMPNEADLIDPAGARLPARPVQLGRRRNT